MAFRSVWRHGPNAIRTSTKKGSISAPATRHVASSPLVDILARVRDGTLSPEEASKAIECADKNKDQFLLESFADLDHDRSTRTGFPEAVFAEGKTPSQVASILDDMARSANDHSRLVLTPNNVQLSTRNPILATRYVQFSRQQRHVQIRFPNGSLVHL